VFLAFVFVLGVSG